MAPADHSTGRHFITNLFWRQMWFAFRNTLHLRCHKTQPSKFQLCDGLKTCWRFPCSRLFVCLATGRCSGVTTVWPVSAATQARGALADALVALAALLRGPREQTAASTSGLAVARALKKR